MALMILRLASRHWSGINHGNGAEPERSLCRSGSLDDSSALVCSSWMVHCGQH